MQKLTVRISIVHPAMCSTKETVVTQPSHKSHVIVSATNNRCRMRQNAS